MNFASFFQDYHLLWMLFLWSFLHDLPLLFSLRSQLFHLWEARKKVAEKRRSKADCSRYAEALTYTPVLFACHCPDQCHPFLPCPLCLRPPQCSSHDFSLSKLHCECFGGQALAASPSSLHWQKCYCLPRLAKLREPQHCINHLVVSFTRCLHVSFNPSFVSVLLCRVLDTDGPPHFPLPTRLLSAPQTTVM